MKMESVGILINLRPFGERDSIAYVFSRDFGVLTGMIKGAAIAKKNKPLVGQMGAVSWNARLDSQLGTFHWESEKNLAAPLMSCAWLLGVMNSVFALIATLLPEREKYDILFDKTQKLLADLADAQGMDDIEQIYLNWEIELLRELGYALNINSCSNCRCTDHLNYLSPRTGRAVCDDCAAPYLTKLFRLPLTLDVTQKFLTQVCGQQGIVLPLSRKSIDFSKQA